AKPFTGRLSDRVGRIPVIVIGLLLCATALPLIFRSESLTAFVLLAPLLGLGVGAVTPVTNALIADLASARRLGAAMGVFGTIWDIGEAAGPMIALTFPSWPEVARVSNLVSFEPDEIDVFLDDRKLALEPGQAVKEHGIDRNLDPKELLKRGQVDGPVTLR